MKKFSLKIAPLKLNNQTICLGVIYDNCFQFYDIMGRSVKRTALNLPEVFIIHLIDDGDEYYYSILKEKEENPIGSVVFVINNENEIIYDTCYVNHFAYVRLATNSVVLWLNIHEFNLSENYLNATLSKGLAVINNKLTSLSYVGCLDEYVVFRENDDFHLYWFQCGYLPNLEEKIYSNCISIWEIDEHVLFEIEKIQADLLCVWKCFYPLSGIEYIYIICYALNTDYLSVYRYDSSWNCNRGKYATIKLYHYCPIKI